MYPQSAALPADISLQCTDEELCMSLEKILDGSPLPGNVIRDVNPYRCAPSNLPDGFWYFIRSSESNPTNIGQWRAKGEASRIFSNSSVYGWRATLEFYQCQAPHETKTNWVMQEYWITQKKSSESSKLKLPVHCQFGWINVQDVWSLCRVFLGDDETPNSNKLQELVNSDRASHSTHSVVPRVEDRGSTSKPRVENEASNDRETGTLVVTERLPVRDDNVQIMHENDYLSRGDYLELLDLDTPASHSFSSVSSCLTMSSDECFDSLALLEELEPKSKQELVTNNNELVVLASSSGSFDKSRDEERIRNCSPNPGSSVYAKIVTENSSKNVSRKQKSDDRNEGPSNSQNANVGGTKKLKRKKYFCFMPF